MSRAFWVVLTMMFALPGSAMADCPSIGVAPRTINGPAESYANSPGFSIDSGGILVYDYGSRYGNAGKFRNPYFDSNYANALYRDYLQTGCKDASLRDQFMLQADFLLNSAERRNGADVWLYPFPAEAFDLAPGWVSGIGQSRIAGVLRRAFALTGQRKYRDSAEAAMKVYEIPPADGGVATIGGDTAWYEEAADLGGVSYKILNGHVTALAGILDYYQITGEDEWRLAFERGVNAVRRDIPKFDAGFISYYSLAAPNLRKFAARGGYNTLHVSQLLWLYQEDGDPIFLDWASRFQAYEAMQYDYQALHSVDPEGHGPDKVAAYFGSSYWSDTPPTWIEVQADLPKAFSGIAIHGNAADQSPKDFTVSANVDGKWAVEKTIAGNSTQQLSLMFDRPITTDSFRVEIESSNGSHNVALSVIVPIPADPQYAPVTNECNYRLGNVQAAFDDDQSVDMRISCPGWVIFPNNGSATFSVDAVGQDGATMKVETSDDLRSWTDRGTVPVQNGKGVTTAKFTRLSFGPELTAIKIISLN